MEQRARYAIAPGAYTKQLLRTIADLSDGDARIAIQTLKNATDIAERKNHEKIGPAHVEQAWNSAKDLKKTYLLLI